MNPQILSHSKNPSHLRNKDDDAGGVLLMLNLHSSFGEKCINVYHRSSNRQCAKYILAPLLFSNFCMQRLDQQIAYWYTKYYR